MTGLTSICWKTVRCDNQFIQTKNFKRMHIHTNIQSQPLEINLKGDNNDVIVCFSVTFATFRIHFLHLMSCQNQQNENAFHSFRARKKNANWVNFYCHTSVAFRMGYLCWIGFVEDFTSTVTLEQLFMIHLNVKINENRRKNVNSSGSERASVQAGEHSTDIENLVKLVGCLIQSVFPCVVFTNHFHII